MVKQCSALSSSLSVAGSHACMRALCAFAVALAVCWMSPSAQAACETQDAKRVFDNLAQAERFSTTNASSRRNAQDIASARAILSASSCDGLALFYAQGVAAQIYLRAEDARGVDQLAAACRIAEQVPDPDRWGREFTCKSALLVGLLDARRFGEAQRLIGSLQSLINAHGQDATALLSDVSKGAADALINNDQDKARAYAQVMDALRSAPTVGPVLEIENALHAAERHLFLGEYGPALGKASEAHQRLEADRGSKRSLIALNVLWVGAQVHLALNQPENALAVMREGEELARGLLSPTSRSAQDTKITNLYLATFYATLARVDLVLGKKPDAQAALEQSKAALAKAGLEGVDQLVRLDRIAAQLEPARAEAILQKSSDLVGGWIWQLREGRLDPASVRLVSELIETSGLAALSSREDRIQLFAALGKALARTDDVAAIKNYIKAIDLIEDGRIQAAGAAEALPSFFSQYVDIYGDLIAVLQKKSGSAQNSAVPADLKNRFGNSYADVALYFSEAAHARAFAESYGPMLLDRFAARTGVPASELQRVKDLHARVGRASDVSYVALIGDDRLAARGDAEQITRTYVEALDSLKARYPDFAKLAYPRPIALAQLPPRLNNHFVVEYKVTGDAVYWWLINNQKIVASGRSEIKRPDLLVAAGQFLERMDFDADTSFDVLRDALVRGPFSQIEKIAPSGNPRVVIVPDDVLYFIPWEALPALHGGRLGERFIVSYAPSLTVLAQAASPSLPAAPGKKALVLGNTLANKVNIDGFAAPFPKLGRDEADKINSLLAQSGYQSVLIAGPPGPRATRQYLFDSQSAQYAVIHIDTHGLAGVREPPPSLLLAPDASSKDFDLVTLPDLAALKLRARLVVLSACQSALGSGFSNSVPQETVFRRLARTGNAIPGEGVLGLARMFMLGGSKAVLASLDEVFPDVSLAFWKAMYEELGSGRAPDVATAVFRAKAALRAQQGMHYPSKWSVFILIGDPNS